MNRAPIRVQRKRKKGWRMPANTAYVGRPGRWGNRATIPANGPPAAAVAAYRKWMFTELGSSRRRELARLYLRGRNLACWCPLDQPCHADVLLEIANAPRYRVLCKEQGTEEWHLQKRGRISASNTKLALARRGGKGRNNYIESLADDLDGVPNFEEKEEAPWFSDGRFYESWARGWYAFKYDVDVEQTGFIVHGDYSWLGCSPDGLIGTDGGVEIKYRKTLRTFKEHAALRQNAQVMAQVQMCMFICDRRWWDYVNYWRSDDHDVEQGSRERIERDDAYIDQQLLPAFVDLWGEVQELRETRRKKFAKRA